MSRAPFFSLRSRAALGASLLLLATAGLIGCTTPTPTPTPTPVPAEASTVVLPSPPILVTGLPNLTVMVARVAPSVVSVITTVEQRDIFGRVVEGVSTGSGVIFDARGYIITNNHVVEGGAKVEVTFHTDPKRTWPVSVVGTDPLTDIAVLKLDPASIPSPLVVTPLGDAEALQIGEWVVAIGSPLGLTGTVTVGVVSAKGRSLDLANVQLIDLIQTDALINPGNSGGPLLNLQGQVIGINTATIRGAIGNGQEAEGLGFAVSATTVKIVVEQLIATGEVVWPRMGVSVRENDPAQAVELGLDIYHGVVILDIVSRGPAEKAGIRPMDVIVALDREEVQTVTRLLQLLRLQHKVGDIVAVTVVRGTDQRTFNVTLERLQR